MPYFGPIVTAAVIGLAALEGFDEPARAVLPPAVFLLGALLDR